MPSTPKTLSATTITGSASVAALLVAPLPEANAQSTPTDAFTVDNVIFNWDVDGNGSTDLHIGDDDSGMSLFAPGSAAGGSWMQSAGGKLAALVTTAMVSTGADFRNGAYITYAGNLGTQAAGFTSVSASYVGFRFKIGSDTHFGWAELTPIFGSGSGAGSSIQVHQWAYNAIAGAAIQVGQTSAVPEPAAAATGLGLLALGAAGLRRQRWLKRKAA